MNKYIFFISLLLIATISQANGIAAQCASLQMQIQKAGGEEAVRSMGLGSVIDLCKAEEKKSYKNAAKSGTLYCSSGDLCASYDFSHSSDRNIYLKSCAQVASCPRNYKDKCSTNNDKVKNGIGTVDWTIYSYNEKAPKNVKKGSCS